MLIESYNLVRSASRASVYDHRLIEEAHLAIMCPGKKPRLIFGALIDGPYSQFSESVCFDLVQFLSLADILSPGSCFTNGLGFVV